MKRKMRRFKQQVSDERCVEILKTAPRGVLALHGEDGYPYAVPLDFYYEKNRLYFHCAPEGHKLDAIRADSRASFCVMDEGFKRDGDWALNITSVIAFGKIRELTDINEKTEKHRLKGNEYYPDPDEVENEIKRFIDRVCILEFSIEHMTGKLVHEK